MVIRGATSALPAFGLAAGIGSVFISYGNATINEAKVRTEQDQVRMYTSSGTYIYVDAPWSKHTTQTNQTGVGDGKIGGSTGSQAGKALANGKYSDLKEPKNVAPGNKTTPAQRKRILEENKKQNNGQLTSDGDGRPLNPPQKTNKGEKADPNAAQVDHIDPAKPKDKSKPAGSNSNANLQVLSAEENRKKSNN